jgi:hypothetical protein
MFPFWQIERAMMSQRSRYVSRRLKLHHAITVGTQTLLYEAALRDEKGALKAMLVRLDYTKNPGFRSVWPPFLLTRGDRMEVLPEIFIDAKHVSQREVKIVISTPDTVPVTPGYFWERVPRIVK